MIKGESNWSNWSKGIIFLGIGIFFSAIGVFFSKIDAYKSQKNKDNNSINNI